MIEINYKPTTSERVIEVDDLKLEINRYGNTYIRVNFPEGEAEVIPLQVIEYSNLLEFVWKCKCGTSLFEDAWKKKEDVLKNLNTLVDKIVLHRSRCFKNGFTIHRAMSELYTLQSADDTARAIAILTDILIHIYKEVQK